MAYKRTLYLVDTENVGNVWVDAIPPLESRDRVILFYTEKSPNYKSAAVEQIIGFSDKVEWVYCGNGTNNALDFQLVSWLGYRLKGAPKTKYIILSNDHGYDPVCSFWKQKGLNVGRQGVTLDTKAKKAKQKADIPAKAQPVVKTLMKQKYFTKENAIAAYNAILTGDQKTIYQVIKDIAGDSSDSDTMKRCWIKQVGCLQKLAG